MAEGFASISQFLNSNLNNGYTVNQALNQMSIIKAVRVYSIVLDETHPRFKKLGEWDALGTVEYVDVNNPQPGPNLPVARPLLSNIKNYPLINEIIYIISLPDTKIGQITSNQSQYYINIVALWNHPHHNAYPSNSNEKPQTQQKDYIQTELGNTSKITNQIQEIELGKTFVERANIHPLLPFEGDITHEGRWGNSIRIGSTVQNTPNNWSTTGTNGDPILILRNGQGKQSDEGWVPVVEDINNDDSSLYFTSTQKIPLQASSTSYNSYSTKPQSPSEFSGKQIILNSGRLIFNSTSDHILLSSNKSVGLNAINSVNIDTPLTIIQSNKVLLGSKDATEPLLYGDITQKLLQDLITSIKIFTDAVFTAKDVVTINIAAKVLNGQVTALEQSILPNIKSKTSYTK